MKDKSIEAWLNELAARTPVPGGGAVAAFAAATAAAQASMVANYTTGTKWPDREARMRELIAELATLQTKALDLAQADAAAFTLLQSTYALPKGSEEEKAGRTKSIQQALLKAAEPPSEIATIGAQLVVICAELLGSANPNVLSDVAVAASLARASLESAIINIEVNARLILDKSQTAALTARVTKSKKAITEAQNIVITIYGKLTS